MKDFEVLDHTADIRLRIYGDTLEGLFINAAKGMFSLITDLKNVDRRVSHHVQERADTLEDLLVVWLQELLYQFHVNRLVCREFFVTLRTEEMPYRIEGYAEGEEANDTKHAIRSREVKAVTYHNVKILHEDRWTTEIIFDV